MKFNCIVHVFRSFISIVDSPIIDMHFSLRHQLACVLLLLLKCNMKFNCALHLVYLRRFEFTIAFRMCALCLHYFQHKIATVRVTFDLYGAVVYY